jgi:Uma2 family endonuclease
MNQALATGHRAKRLSAAQLRERWLQMLDDPLVAAIPFKVELNERGAIEVSPPGTRHAVLQAFVIGELRTQLPHGTTFGECGVVTQIGVRVPDAAWASSEFVARHSMTTPLPNAPDVCVEIISPSNTRIEIDEKVEAYLAAGAREVWLVSEDGVVAIFAKSGRQAASAFGVSLALPQ